MPSQSIVSQLSSDEIAARWGHNRHSYTCRFHARGNTIWYKWDHRHQRSSLYVLNQLILIRQSEVSQQAWEDKIKSRISNEAAPSLFVPKWVCRTSRTNVLLMSASSQKVLSANGGSCRSQSLWKKSENSMKWKFNQINGRKQHLGLHANQGPVLTVICDVYCSRLITQHRSQVSVWLAKALTFREGRHTSSHKHV